MEQNKQDLPRRRERVVPTLSVFAVALAAVAAAVMVKHHDDPVVASAAPAGIAARNVDSPVVTAPPLAAPDTRSMGAGAACKACGVVQTVVAVNEAGNPQARAYQMHIRMDDGSTRTIEQRGALAAGSRVVVEGSSVRPGS